MTTLPPDGMIYGVHADTLAAYVAAERHKIWQAVYARMEKLDKADHDDTEASWFTLKEWVNEQAAKETP